MVFKAKASHILSVFVIFLFTSTCQPLCVKRVNLVEISTGIAKFGISLENELVKINPEKNVVISALSAHTCFGMMRMGAQSSTADDLDVGLGFHKKSTNEIAASYYYFLRGYQGRDDVKIANKLFINNALQVQDKFQNALTKRFFSEVDTIDFGGDKAHLTINNWVEAKTNNLIKDLIPAGSLDSSTSALIVNAVYFKSPWLYEFNKKLTFNSSFYLNENYFFKTPFMFQERDFKYVDLPELKAHAVEIPYKSSDLSFVIVLPYSRTGLKNLMNNLQTTPLSSITERMRTTEVRLFVPKFKIEFEADLKEPLSNMGMSRMFSPAANFRNIIRNMAPIEISKVIHKTFIEVSEEGTEAAAATGLEVALLLSMPTSEEFFANKPFYFAIKDKNDMKLFEGIINNRF